MNSTLPSTAVVAIILTTVLIISSCEGRKFVKHLPAENKQVVEKLEKKHRNEMRCLKRIDALLSSKWSTEVKKIPTKDLGRIKDDFKFVEPSKNMYHTTLQEWLMDKSTPTRRIEGCFEKLKENIKPLMRDGDVRCLNNLLSSRIGKEKEFSQDFVRFLSTSSRDQLPFKRFINFHEFTELMFQNRNPDGMTSQERGVYEHSEAHLSTEDDKEKKIFVLQQSCQWANARKLKEAPSTNARLKAFEFQVRDVFNQQLGQFMVSQSPQVNLTLVLQRHGTWLEVHQRMIKQLKTEVAKLRPQNKSSTWLCEYATTLADKFLKEQSFILTEKNGIDPLILRTPEVARDTRAIEVVLKKRKDIRQGSMNSLAKSIESDSRCLEGFQSLVKQHHLYEAASIFMNSGYTYPELHCNAPSFDLETISPIVCNCNGSFCAAIHLAVLHRGDYKLVRGKDGVYKIVRRVKITSKRR